MLNFGDSFSFQGEDVKLVIYDRLWPTLLLVATSTIASAAIGLLIGIYGGWRRGSRFDVGSQVFTLFVYSMPEFWFGILVLMAFAQGVGPFPSLFPAGGTRPRGRTSQASPTWPTSSTTSRSRGSPSRSPSSASTR